MIRAGKLIKPHAVTCSAPSSSATFWLSEPAWVGKGHTLIPPPHLSPPQLILISLQQGWFSEYQFIISQSTFHVAGCTRDKRGRSNLDNENLKRKSIFYFPLPPLFAEPIFINSVCKNVWGKYVSGKKKDAHTLVEVKSSLSRTCLAQLSNFLELAEALIRNKGSFICTWGSWIPLYAKRGVSKDANTLSHPVL